MHLQPTLTLPTFVSLQPSTRSPAAIIATVSGEVAIVFAAAASPLFDDSMLSARVTVAAAGRCQATSGAATCKAADA